MFFCLLFLVSHTVVVGCVQRLGSCANSVCILYFSYLCRRENCFFILLWSSSCPHACTPPLLLFSDLFCIDSSNSLCMAQKSKTVICLSSRGAQSFQLTREDENAVAMRAERASTQEQSQLPAFAALPPLRQPARAGGLFARERHAQASVLFVLTTKSAKMLMVWSACDAGWVSVQLLYSTPDIFFSLELNALTPWLVLLPCLLALCPKKMKLSKNNFMMRNFPRLPPMRGEILWPKIQRVRKVSSVPNQGGNHNVFTHSNKTQF